MSIKDIVYAIANNTLRTMDVEKFKTVPDIYLVTSALKAQAISININFQQQRLHDITRGYNDSGDDNCRVKRKKGISVFTLFIPFQYDGPQ